MRYRSNRCGRADNCFGAACVLGLTGLGVELPPEVKRCVGPQERHQGMRRAVRSMVERARRKCAERGDADGVDAMWDVLKSLVDGGLIVDDAAAFVVLLARRRVNVNVIQEGSVRGLRESLQVFGVEGALRRCGCRPGCVVWVVVLRFPADGWLCWCAGAPDAPVIWLHVKNGHYRLFVPRGPVELMEARADVARSGRLGKYYQLLPSGAVTAERVCLLAAGLVSPSCCELSFPLCHRRPQCRRWRGCRWRAWRRRARRTRRRHRRSVATRAQRAGACCVGCRMRRVGGCRLSSVLLSC